MSQSLEYKRHTLAHLLAAAVIEQYPHAKLTLGAMASLIEALGAEGVTEGASVSVTAYPARDFTLVDVNALGATKGGALAQVAAHFGVSQSHVFAIGDNHNDVDMLQWAGTGVVMGNAEPELLALGLPIAASNDEAGLAQAIRQYVLTSRA